MRGYEISLRRTELAPDSLVHRADSAGVYILLGAHVLPPVGTLQTPLAVGFGLDDREG